MPNIRLLVFWNFYFGPCFMRVNEFFPLKNYMKGIRRYLLGGKRNRVVTLLSLFISSLIPHYSYMRLDMFHFQILLLDQTTDPLTN